jgi:hypothetical protein
MQLDAKKVRLGLSYTMGPKSFIERMRPPKRRKLQRRAFIPLHAVPSRPARPVRQDPAADRVFSNDRAARLILDTLLTLELREGT